MRRPLGALIAVPMVSLAVACGGADATTPSAGGGEPPVFAEFDPGSFDKPTTIDNGWYPLKPGDSWVMGGVTVEDGESTDHRIEFTVTDLTKQIEGVNTVVAWIEDYSNDELVEAELAFYAQDNDGNVWFLGEYPEEYAAGEFVKAPTWIAGQAEAKAGLRMAAEPSKDMPNTYQGWGPAVEWSDFWKVDKLGAQTCVKVDCYKDVLVVAESSLSEVEMDAFQLKYYARGVGNVRVGFRGADATQEELELVEHRQLSGAELAEVREVALKMEKHAYEVSPEVYGRTTPSK